MLSRLIIDFFYTGSAAISTLFPEVFKKEVPRASVAIAATAVCSMLLFLYSIADKTTAQSSAGRDGHCSSQGQLQS